MKLSLCVICKDEVTAIPVMLHSVIGVVDEICIYDTGSTDGTQDRVREFVAEHMPNVELKVSSGHWENSFAKARNESLKLATGDWILILDCDERLADWCKDSIKPALSTIPEEVDLVLPEMLMCRDDGSVYQKFVCERIIRGNNGITFSGDMHNTVDVSADPSKRVALPEIVLTHNRVVRSESGRAFRAKQRLEMAESIFLKRIEQDPNDRRALFYLAGTYYDCDMHDKALEWFEKYMQVSDWPEEIYQACLLMSDCYLRRKDSQSAKNALSHAIAQNWRRNEAYMELGKIARAEGDLEQAKSWFEIASLKPLPVDPLFVEMESHTWGPHSALCEINAELGNTEKAMFHGEQAVELGAKFGPEMVRYRKNHSFYQTQNICCLVDRGQMDFIAPVIEHWREQGKLVDVVTDPEAIKYDPGAYHIYWCEWAGTLAKKVSEIPKTARVIVRIHGYEVYSGLIKEVNWENVDDVIFVSRHLRDVALLMVPGIGRLCNVYVVPGGVSTEFEIGCSDNKKIAMLGYVNSRKNIPLALQILARCPDHELHIAGEWQDAELHEYVVRVAEQLGVSDRLFIYGRIGNVAEFFSDKSFILSTSVRETFHYAVAEGMMAGLKPIIHNWLSASEFYDDRWLFNSVDEAVEMLSSRGEPGEFAQYAKDNLSIDRNLRRIDRVINRPAVAVSGNPKYAHATEYDLMRALESIGCVTDAKKCDGVILMGYKPEIEHWMDGARKLWWQMELCEGDTPKAKGVREAISETIPHVDVIASAEPAWVKVCKQLGGDNVQLVRNVGACWPWCKLNEEKRYDIGFYGVMTERRQIIINELSKLFDIHVFDPYDHEQCNVFVNQCKILLNIRAYEEMYCQCRPAEGMAAGTCVVSEQMSKGHPFPQNCFFETDQLAVTLDYCLRNDELCEATAKRGYEWIWSKRPYELIAEELLDAMGI